jgi:hypothetical protein
VFALLTLLVAIKELIHHDKTMDYLEANRTAKDDALTISITDVIRNEFEDIETERQIFESEKRKFEDEKSRFQREVILFNAYVQTEYKRLVNRYQL